MNRSPKNAPGQGVPPAAGRRTVPAKSTPAGRATLVAAIAAALALLAGGCGKDTPVEPGNHPPVVRRVVANPTVVARGGQAQFTALADDAENDPLTYAWSAPIGSFNDTTQARVRWTAPDSAMTVRIRVVVSDGTATTTGLVDVGVGSATIVVESVPEGAPIVLNGSDTGRVTPWTFTGVAATAYNVQVSSSYFIYSPSDWGVELADGDTGRVEFVLPAIGREDVDLGPDPLDEIGTICYSPEDLGLLYTARAGTGVTLRSAGLTPWRVGANGAVLETGVPLEERLSLRVPSTGSPEVAFVRNDEIRIGRLLDPNHDGLMTALDTVITLRTTSIYSYGPSFSPDGTLLAYGLSPSTQPNDMDVLVVGEYDTTTVTGIRRVTGMFGNAVTFGPSGKVAFEMGGEIYTARVDESGTTIKVTSTGGHARAPAYSPSGHFVAYIDDRGYVELLVPDIKVTTRLCTGVNSLGVAWADGSRELAVGDNSTPGQARMFLLTNLPIL
jgi:hypothetical protein